MSKYFHLSPKNLKKVASAFASDEFASKMDYELIDGLMITKKLPFKFHLVSLSIRKGELFKENSLSGLEDIWLDYLPNNLAYPLMSEKLKFIIESHLSGQEMVKWIDVIVEYQNRKRIYYLPFFEKKLDVLDLSISKFIPGTKDVLVPVFSRKKIKDLNVFHLPKPFNLWRISSLYVNAELKKLIMQQKFTGIKFEEAWIE